MTAMSAYLDTARRVIRTEIDGLQALAAGLDDSFDRAIEIILAARGRVVVSGMGKSGHVGRKIAATLASTGTPAQFVHPGEASHGDLGMVTENDVALVLSNSGETPELADLIAHTRRFSIPLIGVASRPGSTLLRQSDVALVLPAAPEACGSGIVPTTSTTMTMALGDALAIALMEHRKFTPEHFRTFHPGGKLGAKLSRVGDLMHRDIPLVAEGAPMSEALLVISQKGFGVTGVTDAQGALSGIITDGDLRRHMQGLLDLRAEQVMTRGPRTISPDKLAEEALAQMQDRKITSLFAVEGDRPVGLLHIHDFLRTGMV
ncbi:KpsF/GutQ family sugar-phosphate isomerase [Paracoccus yeei]|mgnify:FL=1|jgi:arabinose-5-phosphate isomerase|uniref:KpsF/GutQ family sugar-phosphate isomerase n=3 Tax=Paracoccus TaxID=265 RepID=A0A386UQ80_9RHOB|nr:MULTISPECIES: KpsF/GutQ family sugar-phosphate isomerase [Paracoccus]AYF02955.1 KpsF/GutQ family sugar-phosphate isomerase [Paracoccus yeei]MBY0136750.1 KpsF/GutQ family sugar-phosphate isomerase [Paracoccus yeei]